MSEGNGSWEENRKLLLVRTEENTESIKSMDEKLDRIAIQLTELGTKQKMTLGIYGGAVGGSAGLLGGAALNFLKSVFGQ